MASGSARTGRSQTGFPPSQAPSRDYPFGTDQLGRDVLSRVMAGARDVLLVSPIAALLSVIAGTLFGLVGGYIRGVVDEVISRFMEAMLAIPVILMGLLVFTTFGVSTAGPDLHDRVLVHADRVPHGPRRHARRGASSTTSTSARLRGEGAMYIMTREIVPNITGPIVVELTVRVGYAIFTLATLKFVAGAGKPEEPEWGNMVNQTYGLIQGGTWWPTIFPALAIASLVIAVNLIADSLETVYSS